MFNVHTYIITFSSLNIIEYQSSLWKPIHIIKRALTCLEHMTFLISLVYMTYMTFVTCLTNLTRLAA